MFFAICKSVKRHQIASDVFFPTGSLTTVIVINTILTELHSCVLQYKWIVVMCGRHSGLKELQEGEDDSAEEKDNWIKDKWISYSGRHL